MIDQFVALCFRKHLVVRLIAIFACVFGIYAWSQLAIDAYPLLSPVAVQVTAQVPGLAAEEIEQQITIPLERALNGTPGLTSMRSISTFALSQINLLFRDGAEDYWERQRVRDRIGDVTLPAGVQTSLDPVTAPELEIYRYTLESDTKNLMELSEIQRWIIQPALRQVQGVAGDDNFGGFTRQFRLDLDPTELLRYGIGINDVINAINNNTANAGGGRVPRGDQSFIVRGVGLVRSLDDLGNVVVTQTNSMPVLIRDLGTLSYAHQEPEGILGMNANPATIEGIVTALKYANVSEVIAGIHAKVEELRKQLEPQDVHIVPVLDRSDLVAATVTKIGNTLLEGIGLVIVVLMLFLGSPRSALVVAVTIPLAVVSIFVLMNATHMSASMLSLGALDFGVIVDGAIVVTENILRRREAKPTEELTEEDVKSATSQVARPIFFATLIIITAYFPLFTLQRGEAALFTPMAYTVGFALFGALLCTLALIPGLAYLAFRKPRPPFRNKPLEWLGRAYRVTLGRLLDRPILSYLATGLAFVAVGVLGTFVGRDYLPDLDEGSLWLQVQLPSGLSLDAASDMASELRRAVREFPEVRYIMTQLGREDAAVDAWTFSHVEAPIGLTPYDTWPKGETKADFVRKLNARLRELPGFNVGINQPISDMVFDAVGGAHSKLVIRVVGDDFSEDRRIAGEIVDILRNTRGTAEASIFQEPPLPQIAIETDRAAAARYGINISDITNLIQTGVGGAAVTQVYVGDRTYDVTVRFPLSARLDPDALGNLPLTSSTGARVPLSQVAKITQRNGEGTITRDQQSPQSDDSNRFGRSRHRVLPGGGQAEDRAIGSIRPVQISPRIWRAVREPGSRPAAIHVDSRPRARGDDAVALHRVRTAASGLADSRDPAARHPGRPDCALRHGSNAQRRDRGRVHCTVRRSGSERHHHGGKPQPGPRQRCCASRRGGFRRIGTLPARADDGNCCDHRHGAGGAGDRRRERRPTRRRDRRDRRVDLGDLADIVRGPELLLFIGKYRGALAGSAAVGAIAELGSVSSCKMLTARRFSYFLMDMTL